MKKGLNEPGEIRTLDLQVRNLTFWTVSVYPLNYGPVYTLLFKRGDI